MLKGAQKQMIVVRTGDSRYFDEAYFILRREVPPGGTGRAELLREANRILEESGIERVPSEKKRRPWLLFGAGLLSGAGVLALLLLLLL